MKISNIGIEFIREHEGCKPHVYNDVAGLPTIGVGHLLTQDELNSGKIQIGYRSVKYANGLSSLDINMLLDQDLDRFEKAVSDSVTVKLAQHEFDCLVSFSFNVGVGAFLDSTLLKLLNKGHKSQVPAQLARWIYSGGRKIRGLVNRRAAEAELWRTPYKKEEVEAKEKKIEFVAKTSGHINHVTKPNGTQIVQLVGDWVQNK